MYVRKRSWGQSVRMFSVLAAAALLPAVTVAAERETISTITRIYTYTQFGDGDVMVEVATPAPGCGKGFWLSPNDPGFKVTYALLLSMYHTQSTARVGGEDTQLWSGSGSVYCRMTFAAGI